MRTNPTRASAVSALLSLAIVAGCGDNLGSPLDAAPPDAAPAPDANEPIPDASVPAFDRTRKTQELSTGITMAYVETGSPGGEVVIMIPGYTDSVVTFFPTMEALAASNTELHVYALDMRGHGGSSMPADSNCPAAPEECFQMTDMMDDVIAFMDARDIAAAHVVGYSMGSVVAQELALAHPARVESLILTGNFVYGVGNPVFEGFLIPQVEEMWREALEATAGFQFPQDAYALTPMAADPDIVSWVANNWMTEKTAPADLVAELVLAAAETKLGAWIGALRDFAKFDSRQRLEALTVRTLVMWGIQDRLFPEDPDQARGRAALDLALEACNLDYYYFKTYGKTPRPPGSPVSDLGHGFMRGAGKTMAADITAWVTTGAPTTDLAYADPDDLTNSLVDEGAAEIIEKHKPETCP